MEHVTNIINIQTLSLIILPNINMMYLLGSRPNKKFKNIKTIL